MGCYVNIESDCSVVDNIRNNYKNLYAAEAKVANFILEHPEKALEANVSETAEYSGVSDATVIRFCKRLGFVGFYQMKLQLSHDFGMRKRPDGDGDGGDTGTATDVLYDISQAIGGLSRTLDAGVIMKCVDVINKSEIIYVVGSGHSRVLANDFVFRLSRFGLRTMGGTYTDTDIEAVTRGTDRDALICISHSGETKKTIQAQKIAALRGMTTIAITDSQKNPLAQSADLALSSGICSRRNFNGTVDSFIYMLAIVDTILAHVDKRENDDDSYIDKYLAESRM